MERTKVIAVISILVVFVMVIGAYYGMIPTLVNKSPSNAETMSENKAVLEGIPNQLTMTNTSQASFGLMATGVSGVTTNIYMTVIDSPTNVSVYFTTASSQWKIENNGTVAIYKGFPLCAGDMTDYVTLHIDANGNPSAGTVLYEIHSNDVLVVKNNIQTTITV